MADDAIEANCKAMAVSAGNVATEIARRIVVVRGRRVLLDSDLARLYGVSTKARNRSQSVTGSQKHRDPRFAPYAFTEHGSIMAATVLNSPRAVEMTVYIVRAFVELRALLASNESLARKLDTLERSVLALDEKARREIAEVYAAIRALMAVPAPRQRPIGFTANLDDDP